MERSKRKEGMDRLTAYALRVVNARANGSRRISRSFLNELILFALVERGLAHWETPRQMVVVVH